METYDAIMSRRSVSKLRGRTPTKEEVERLLQAAVMAPNHHLTEPWRFVVIASAASEELGQGRARASRRQAGRDDRRLHLPRSRPIQHRQDRPTTDTRRGAQRVARLPTVRSASHQEHPVSDSTIPPRGRPTTACNRPDAKLPATAHASTHDSCPCVTVKIPDMSDRGDIRIVTARIRDVPGVVAVAADLAARQVHVEGIVSRGDVRAAVLAAGYTVTADTP
jgi:nitroreductase